MGEFEPTNQGLSSKDQERDILILLHPEQYSPDDYMATLLRHESRVNSQPIEPENQARKFFKRNLQAQGIVEASPGHFIY